MCVGRYCDDKLLVETGLSRSVIAVVVVVSLLAVLVVVLLALLLRARTQRRHTGRYRPSDVEHKAATLPLSTVAASSTSTTPMHLVDRQTKHQVLV